LIDSHLGSGSEDQVEQPEDEREAGHDDECAGQQSSFGVRRSLVLFRSSGFEFCHSPELVIGVTSQV
jgi:hypothetical protein